MKLILAIFLALMGFHAIAEVDFSGKEISIIVPFKNNGGTYTWASFNAPYLSKHLPGNPKVRVKDQPGGGSTKAANRYALFAQPDGLTLLTTARSTQLAYMLGDRRVKYDYKDWQVLMAYPNGGAVYADAKFNANAPFELARLHREKWLFASIGVTSFDAIILLCFDLLDLNVTPIFGMRGREAARLAFERGDSNLDFQTSSAYMKYVQPIVDQGKATPLFTLGVLNEKGNMVRDPQFPNIPTFDELYLQVTQGKGHKTSKSLAIVNYVGFIAQKLLVLPKETPRAVVQTYHSAIQAMLNDPEYIKEAQKVLGSYKQVTGQSATDMYQKATQIPKQHKEQLRAWLKTKYKVNL